MNLLDAWENIPDNLRPAVNRLLFLFYDKKTAELKFQEQWAKEFKKNKKKVQEYWLEYRHLGKISDTCMINEDSKILDVGCGISTILHFLDGKKTGIDPLANDYKKFYDYPEDVKIIKASGEDIPFASESFDVVFCSNVLDHTQAPNKVISEIQRVLKKNGKLVLTVEIFPKRQKRDPAHPHSLTKADIIELLSSRFKIIFDKTSPWISPRSYVRGGSKARNYEYIVICEKK